MGLVTGLPLTAFAREERLSISERVTLMIKLAEAVQQAHERRVIHRDLKPVNIPMADGA